MRGGGRPAVARRGSWRGPSSSSSCARGAAAFAGLAAAGATAAATAAWLAGRCGKDHHGHWHRVCVCVCGCARTRLTGRALFRPPIRPLFCFSSRGGRRVTRRAATPPLLRSRPHGPHAIAAVPRRPGPRPPPDAHRAVGALSPTRLSPAGVSGTAHHGSAPCAVTAAVVAGVDVGPSHSLAARRARRRHTEPPAAAPADRVHYGRI